MPWDIRDPHTNTRTIWKFVAMRFKPLMLEPGPGKLAFPQTAGLSAEGRGGSTLETRLAGLLLLLFPLCSLGAGPEGLCVLISFGPH